MKQLCGRGFLFQRKKGTLLDAISVETTAQNDYGKLRLFGALGYGAGAGLMGVLLHFFAPSNGSWQSWLDLFWFFASFRFLKHYKQGHSLRSCGTLLSFGRCQFLNPFFFACKVVTNAVGMIVALFLRPVKEETSPPPADVKSTTDSETKELLVNTDTEDKKDQKDVRRKLSAEAIVGLILFGMVVFVCGCASGVINTFLFVFFETLPDGTGFSQGISVSVTTAFEIPVFFFSRKILDRVSVEWLVCVSLISYCVRLASYYLFSIYRPSAYYAFFSETLHGLTFALLWASVVARAQALVKGGYSKSGLTMAVAQGIGQLGRSLASFGGGFALQSGASMKLIWFVSFW